MADLVFESTETNALRQEIVAAMVQRELIEGGTIAPTVMDVSQFATSGSDRILFPRGGSFTVQKKQEGEQAQAQVITYATDSLDLDQEAVVQWVLPKRTVKQAAAPLVADTIARAARAHAQQVDVDLLASMSAGASLSVSLSGSFGREEITEARRLLRGQFWPMAELTLAISPNLEEDMLNVSDFINADAYGNAAPIQNGEIGKVFGVRVVVSPNISGDVGYMYHREGMALGFQSMPELDSAKDLENLGTRYSLDQLYGLSVLQSGNGIVAIS